MQNHLPRALWSRPEVGTYGAVADLVSVERDIWRVKRLCAYEIKSSSDSLRRLPDQIVSFLPCIDLITVVCAPKHVAGVERVLEKLHVATFVGVRVANESHHGIFFTTQRTNVQNPHVTMGGMWQLLWNPERLALLAARACAKGVRGKSSAAMLERAQSNGVTLTDVRWHVAQCWEERDWDAFKREREAKRARRAQQAFDRAAGRAG